VHQGTTPVVRRAIEPRVLRTINLPGDQRAPMLQGFEGVTSSAGGTAYYAFTNFPAWVVAGKTGTAQVTGGSDNALFVGFGPSEGAQVAGVAVLENSGFGAVAAAPVIRRVFQGIADPAQQPHVGPGGLLDKPVPGSINTDTVAVRD
jgi:penicillin-binding protein 2